MSMNLEIYALTDKDFRRFTSDPERLEELIETTQVESITSILSVHKTGILRKAYRLDVGAAWDILFFLLSPHRRKTDSTPSPAPLEDAILMGHQQLDEDFDMGYGAPAYNDPLMVQKICDYLQEVTLESLKGAVDLEATSQGQVEVYGGSSMKQDYKDMDANAQAQAVAETFFEYIPDMKEFYRRASNEKRWVLSILT